MLCFGYCGDGPDDFKNVESYLQSGVCQIVPAHKAFAALKDDGSVVSWGELGDEKASGKWKSVSEQLSSGVLKVEAAHEVFGALKSDGSVMC